MSNRWKYEFSVEDMRRFWTEPSDPRRIAVGERALSLDGTWPEMNRFVCHLLNMSNGDWLAATCPEQFSKYLSASGERTLAHSTKALQCSHVLSMMKYMQAVVCSSVAEPEWFESRIERIRAIRRAELGAVVPNTEPPPISWEAWKGLVCKAKVFADTFHDSDWLQRYVILLLVQTAPRRSISVRTLMIERALQPSRGWLVFENGSWLWVLSRTKNSRIRGPDRIRISAKHTSYIDSLVALRRKQGLTHLFVTQSKKEPFLSAAWATYFKRITKRLNGDGPGCTQQQVRQACVIYMRENRAIVGVAADDRTGADLLGHSPRVQQAYYDLASREKRVRGTAALLSEGGAREHVLVARAGEWHLARTIRPVTTGEARWWLILYRKETNPADGTISWYSPALPVQQIYLAPSTSIFRHVHVMHDPASGACRLVRSVLTQPPLVTEEMESAVQHGPATAEPLCPGDFAVLCGERKRLVQISRILENTITALPFDEEVSGTTGSLVYLATTDQTAVSCTREDLVWPVDCVFDARAGGFAIFSTVLDHTAGDDDVATTTVTPLLVSLPVPVVRGDARRSWSADQDEQLCKLVANYGQRWKTIERHFTDGVRRSANSLRQRWLRLSAMKEKEREMEME